MHPDLTRLAMYLDGALDEAARADVRGHLLACSACAARLERLRADARRITASAAGPTPDVRAAVRARLRRGRPSAWLVRGGAAAGALAALLLFALLISVRAGGMTLGREPDRLFAVDRNNGRLLALDAGSGAFLGSALVGDTPTRVRYDPISDRLYVIVRRAILSVDPRTLAVVARWDTPQPFALTSGIALDARRGRLYVAQPDAASIVVLDTATLTPSGSFGVGRVPGALALTPDGGTLFALDGDGTLWTIDTLGGTRSAQSLSGGERWPLAWLALSADGRTLYVLQADSGSQGWTPQIWRVDVLSGRIGTPVALPPGQAPWDLLLLDDGRLAIPRGDGRTGGITLVAPDDLRLLTQVSPDSDEHHAVAGPGGSMFTLNFSHATVKRYDLASSPTETWQVQLDGQQQAMPYDGVYVPGGWRWPW
jgi:DNA-binding beta-propeller fold protein YncE